MFVPTQSVWNENEKNCRDHDCVWFTRSAWEPKKGVSLDYQNTIPKNKKTGKPCEKDLPV
jgi:hypothetical protein